MSGHAALCTPQRYSSKMVCMVCHRSVTMLLRLLLHAIGECLHHHCDMPGTGIRAVDSFMSRIRRPDGSFALQADACCLSCGQVTGAAHGALTTLPAVESGGSVAGTGERGACHRLKLPLHCHSLPDETFAHSRAATK